MPGPDAPTHKAVCNDPTHSEDCDCGARPDHEYEKRIENNL